IFGSVERPVVCNELYGFGRLESRPRTPASIITNEALDRTGSGREICSVPVEQAGNTQRLAVSLEVQRGIQGAARVFSQHRVDIFGCVDLLAQWWASDRRAIDHEMHPRIFPAASRERGPEQHIQLDLLKRIRPAANIEQFALEKLVRIEQRAVVAHAVRRRIA